MDMITEGELKPQEAPTERVVLIELKWMYLFWFKDEASLYDRQIRLWGLEAQNR